MAAIDPSSARTRMPDPALVIVVLASIGFGTVPFFMRGLSDAGLIAPAVVFYRYTFTAILLAPFLRFSGAMRSASLWGFFSGAMVALGWIGYVEALKVLPVSTVGVIYMTYPVFTIAEGWLFFGERPQGRSLVAGGMIVLGAALASTPASVPMDKLPYLLVAFTAPFAFGTGINILARKMFAIPPLSRLACKSLGSVVGLGPLILLSPLAAVVPAGAHDWALIAGIAVITALVPQLLYNIYAPKIGATLTAAAGSIELPTMFVVGAMAFSEPIGPLEAVAGALVIAAILITPRQRPGTPEASGRRRHLFRTRMS
ncbi:DMT family transporter [Pararhizobium mangrovi]|uniref:DMT family transporter n=1 Tax=Pararhizobium mangrovi TaxID=2590452 RepID=A0A506TWN0_9HYPH|nr:DMT family transporter [Pararhizobium mangrovi]TPW25910.1 DMT family transporter [Pararhizobium mangrovi]